MKTHIKFAFAASALVLSAALAFAQGTLTTGMSQGIAQPATSLTPATAATDTALAVPPGIALPAIPIGNHYVCYPVKESTAFQPRTATFHDQFGTFTATVYKITHLCTPALKRAGGKVYQMVNPKLHLTCYAIKYQGPLPPKVITNDQFGAKKLILGQATTVCLPAGKVIIK